MNHRRVSVLRIMPAKIDPNVEGGIAVRVIEVAPIEKDRVASSIARRRKKNDRIVHRAASEDRRADRTASPMPVRLAARTVIAKIDIIIIDRARRLRRNHFRRSR